MTWTQGGKILMTSAGETIACATCPCGGGSSGIDCTSFCDAATTPNAYTLDLGGVSNNSCTNCSYFNTASIVVTQLTSQPCLYAFEEQHPCAGSSFLKYQASLELQSTRVVVTVSYTLDGDQATFEKALAAPYDCQTEVTGSYTLTTSVDGACTWSSATLTVSV